MQKQSASYQRYKRVYINIGVHLHYADRQTLMGKLPERVLQRALAHGVPVRLVAGRVDDKDILTAAGFAGVDAITPDGMDTEEAVKPEVARQNIREWVRRELDPAHLSSQR